MGTLLGKEVKVTYKACRDSHEVGQEIRDPKEWFNMLFVDDRENTVSMFNGLEEDMQNQLIEKFDGMDVFREDDMYLVWRDMVEDSGADFEEKKRTLEEWFS